MFTGGSSGNTQNDANSIKSNSLCRFHCYVAPPMRKAKEQLLIKDIHRLKPGRFHRSIAIRSNSHISQPKSLLHSSVHQIPAACHVSTLKIIHVSNYIYAKSEFAIVLYSTGGMSTLLQGNDPLYPNLQFQFSYSTYMCSILLALGGYCVASRAFIIA